MKLGVWQKDMTVIAEFARAVGRADAAVRGDRPDLHCCHQGRQRRDTAAVCAVLERTGEDTEESSK